MSSLLQQRYGNQFTDSSSPCLGTYYADRSDIELIFGANNIVLWANLDNDDVVPPALPPPSIDARICWALQLAHNQINDRLNGGMYLLPFIAPYPTQVVDACARLAGVFLYEGRGVVDAHVTPADQQPTTKVEYHRKLIEKFFNRILSDRIQLLGQVRSKNYPNVVKDS